MDEIRIQISCQIIQDLDLGKGPNLTVISHNGYIDKCQYLMIKIALFGGFIILGLTYSA